MFIAGASPGTQGIKIPCKEVGCLALEWMLNLFLHNVKLFAVLKKTREAIHNIRKALKTTDKTRKTHFV